MKKLLVVTGILVAFGAVLPGVANAETPSLVVQTVPRLKGVVFTVGGRNYVTDAHGVVRINNWSPGGALELKTPEVKGNGFVARFARWGDPRTGNLIAQPTGDLVQVGFDVYYRMAREFLGPQGDPLDPKTISSVQIRAGDSTTIDPATDCGGSIVSFCLLKATQLLNTKDGLRPVTRHYVIPTVTRTDGVNIAAPGEVNEFTTDKDGFKPNGVWQIHTVAVQLPAPSGNSFDWSFIAAAVGTLIFGGLLFFVVRRRIRS